jgi:hypothetical protein
MKMSYHQFCYDALVEYIELARHTRKRFFTLGEFKLWAELKKTSFSTRAIHNLVNHGLIVRCTGLSGVFEIVR